LTGEFLYLEGEIDNFALQYEYYPSKTMGALIRLGKHAGLVEQLTLIEGKAPLCARRPRKTVFGLTWPGRAEHAGTAGD
jgi:hypothetical protein